MHFRKVGAFNVHADFRGLNEAVQLTAFVLVVILVCSSTGPSPGQELEAGPSSRDWFAGELQLGLDAARSSRDGDITLNQVLRLKIDPPKHERFHIRTTLWTIEDLDGREDPTSTLRTLNDASGAGVNVRLLSLYLEVDDVGGESTLRLGRQRITDGVVYNRIDGAYYKLRGVSWEGYAFGGVRASVYGDAHEELATGGGVSVRLPTKTRLGVDFFYGADERRRIGAGNIETSITSVSLYQSLTSRHSVFGRVTWNETDIDELRLTAQGFFEKSEIVYTLMYHNRMSTLTERVTDVSDFFRVVGEFNEFQDIHARVDIPITKSFGLGLEAQVHVAENAALESGNRDFERYGISVDTFDFIGHFDASVILEYWNADFGEGQWTATGEISREWERTEAAVGIDYDLFEDRVTSFDPALQSVVFVETHEHIYSFYAKVEHEINEQHKVRIRALFENDDGPDAPYWRLRAEYTLTF